MVLQALVRVEEKHVETIQSREKDITMLNGQIEKLQSDLISSNKQVLYIPNQLFLGINFRGFSVIAIIPS